MRFSWTSLPLVATQTACIAMVFQGNKSLEVGRHKLSYGPGQFLVAPVDLPAVSRITKASDRKPLLGIAVQIHFDELKDLLRRCEGAPGPEHSAELSVFSADADLLESVVRLLRLLDTKEHVKVLAPLMRVEILYRLVSGAAGPQLLEICRSGSPSNRIANATTWLRKHFAEKFLIRELARRVGMSVSSFHQHFKAVTGMTPLQYQKCIRLQEARKSLLLDSFDIGEVSVRVGYESHSQFSRDYRNYFGRLPKHDLTEFSRSATAITDYRPAATRGL